VMSRAEQRLEAQLPFGAAVQLDLVLRLSS
jgi:hypothetical protein